tara:strand:+ start:6833 stop:7024 length:192 start_codon:yes stop_codon:yes gene_type:complete
MKYINIKKILRKQINDGVKSLWTFDEEDNIFTMIYKSYTDELPIYTPQQLIDKLKEYEREKTQ